MMHNNKELDLKYFEEKLLDLQEQIMGIAQLVGTSAQPVVLDQNKVGRLSRMDALQGQAIAQASADRQQNQLILIADALERIDEGDYGRCRECDQFIAVGRLDIEPTALCCVACAEKLEG